MTQIHLEAGGRVRGGVVVCVCGGEGEGGLGARNGGRVVIGGYREV